MWRKLLFVTTLAPVLLLLAPEQPVASAPVRWSVDAPAPAPAPAPAAAPAAPVQVPVLLYHDLQPGARGENGAVIPVAEFEAQMAYLKAGGYTAITTAELGAWLSGSGTLPVRPVLITFDDGYRSGYQYAFPLLKRYGMKATIFMVTGLAGQRDGDLTYLSGAEMQEMERSGVVEIQAHTHDGHRQVSGRPALLTWSEGEIRTDLRQLQASLTAANLGAAGAFAYPFGAYDAETVGALRAEGMRLGFTVANGHVRQGDEPFELRRLIIFPGTSECRFGEILTGRPAGTCGK